MLHGDNCIGNNGKTEGCPIIGDNVDIGTGAKILGAILNTITRPSLAPSKNLS